MGLTLTVYTAENCSLCDEARIELDGIAPVLDIDVEWISIDGDEALEAAWRCEIPVGMMEGRKLFKYRVDADVLRRRVIALRRP